VDLVSTLVVPDCTGLEEGDSTDFDNMDSVCTDRCTLDHILVLVGV
jgi:hypothetical protein